MEVQVWLACTHSGWIIGAFRTRGGAIKCLKENALALFEMDSEWTDKEKASVINTLEEYGSAAGFGYVKCVGELGD